VARSYARKWWKSCPKNSSALLMRPSYVMASGLSIVCACACDVVYVSVCVCLCGCCLRVCLCVCVCVNLWKSVCASPFCLPKNVTRPDFDNFVQTLLPSTCGNHALLPRGRLFFIFFNFLQAELFSFFLFVEIVLFWQKSCKVASYIQINI